MLELVVQTFYVETIKDWPTMIPKIMQTKEYADWIEGYIHNVVGIHQHLAS